MKEKRTVRGYDYRRSEMDSDLDEISSSEDGKNDHNLDIL